MKNLPITLVYMFCLFFVLSLVSFNSACAEERGAMGDSADMSPHRKMVDSKTPIIRGKNSSSKGKYSTGLSYSEKTSKSVKTSTENALDAAGQITGTGIGTGGPLQADTEEDEKDKQ